MSIEMITVLIGIVSILLAFAGAFGWMVHRMDLLENRLEYKIGARIDRAADELVEVKIAIARVEGPPRHLLAAR